MSTKRISVTVTLLSLALAVSFASICLADPISPNRLLRGDYAITGISTCVATAVRAPGQRVASLRATGDAGFAHRPRKGRSMDV